MVEVNLAMVCRARVQAVLVHLTMVMVMVLAFLADVPAAMLIRCNTHRWIDQGLTILASALGADGTFRVFICNEMLHVIVHFV